MEIINSIPPEIWNKIVYYSDNQNFIRILVYHSNIFRLDLLYLKIIYQRNIDDLKIKQQQILIDAQVNFGFYLLDYASLYPSSMISENITT
tara:strand:- start:621 stop:893 length:273 start_codon:yes stop_codon:yes gene_type:complete